MTTPRIPPSPKDHPVPTRDLEEISRPVAVVAPPQAAQISQMTAVEQARAVAEVQAAVMVAQAVPRDMGRAYADMRQACSRIRLAERAFYSVPNRGSGPSVHLMRELARIFGNLQFGVHELRRDDEAGISEVQAFAWDVERNTRSTRTFIVPHAKMVKVAGKQTRQPLIDLQDIYLNNQNIGARAMREVIDSVLPKDYTDEAQEIAHDTLKQGDGQPIEARVAAMVSRFAQLNITAKQLEERVGKARTSWQPVDLAQLTILGQSIARGEVTKEDEFPQNRVTAAEITGQAKPPQTASGSGGEALPPVTTPEEAEHAQQVQAQAAASWGDEK
jgi:hypothetical protein